MATRMETPYTRRARCSSSADGFSIKRPAVPAPVFTAARDLALFLIVQGGGLHSHTRTMGFSDA